MLKLSHHGMKHAFSNVKNFIGNAYHKTKSFLGDVNSGYKMAKTIYGAVAPILDQVSAGKNINKHVMKAVNDFDSIRDKVMDTHSSVINNVNNVKGNLKKHYRFRFF